jgi:hypothetical protein
MPVVSDSAIAQYAAQAGFKGANLRIAVAVALAESSGRTDVVNYLGCVGLWQIYQRMHPKWSTAQLKNPAINAQAAYEISSGGKSWAAWTTYTSGGYKRFMSRANAAAGSAGSAPNPSDATTAIPGFIPGADTANAVGHAVSVLSNRQTWLRVGEVALGVLLVFLALFWLTAKKAAPLAKTAVNVLPAGRIANVAKAVTKVAKK